jgi:signal transduction histidine kinase
VDESTEARAAALAEIARFPEMNPGPVLRLDLDANVLLANAAARAVFGEGVVGHCWKDVCPGMDEAMWERMVGAAEPVPIETRVGEHDYVFTHRRDHDGDLVFVFGADITAQKHSERALRQTEKMAALGKLSAGLAHELNNPAAAAGRAASQLQLRLDEHEAAMIELARSGIDASGWVALAGCYQAFRIRVGNGRPLSALAASDREAELGAWLEERGVSHAWEMAPMFTAALLAPADLADVAARLPERQLGVAMVWLCKGLEVSELASTVARSSKTISDLVGVVKSYSHMDQAPVSDVDVHQGLEDTLRILGHELRRKEIDIVREYDRSLPPIHARGNELNQVWTNLVDNAIDAMGQGGALTIRTALEGDAIVVQISDDGPGIPEDVQAQMFDPFFTTKEVGEGTGLGLDVARRIVVERSGGEIGFTSRPGETIFRVSLPLRGNG